MSQDLNLRLRITGDGSGLKGELRTASGEVVKFGDTLEGGAKRGTRALKETENQTDSLGNTTQQLTRRVGALVAGYVSLRSLAGLGQMADQYTNLNAQIRLVTTSAGEQRMVFEEVEDIASRTGQALDTVSRLTTRTIRALISSGDSAAEATQRGLALTNVISNAVLVSGAGAAESNAAIIQLSQGLASGVLRGEEFNSVMEQTPRIAQALANALGLTLGQLRELAIEGGLTTEIVTEALLSQAETLEREAATIPPTIGRAWQALRNAVTAYVGEADAGIGASQQIAESLNAVAENLDTVVDIAEILAVLIGGRLVVSLGAATKAKVIAIATSQAYRGALVGLAGMSNTAAAGQLALAAATRTATGALALIGGPIGALIVGAGAVAMASRAYARDLDSLADVSEESRAALDRLAALTGEDWDHRPIQAYRDDLQILRDDLEQTIGRMNELQSGPSLERRDRVAPMGGGSHERELNALTERREALESQIEIENELIRLREHQAGLAYHEDIAAGLDLVRWAGESVTDVFEQMGLSWAGSKDGISESITELLEPLGEYSAKLEQELFVLQQVTEGRQTAAMALLDYQEAQAQAQAVTEADTAAVRAKFAELRRLQGAIEDVRQSTEEAAEAEKTGQQQQQRLSQMAAAYQSLLATINPLAAEQEKLSSGLAMMQELAGRSADELDSLGVSGELLQQVIAGLEQELSGLGGNASFFPFSDGEEFTDLIDDAIEKMQELADIEWNLEGFLDSFHPLAGEMRRLGDEIKLIDSALEEGLIGNAEAGFMKVGASANAAFGAMMAGVDQTSKEYKALEIAQQATNVALGIAAILQQGMGDPYTAIPRMIAMAAMVAQLVGSISGFSGGGGGGLTAEDRQKTQGTGSVLGDRGAETESIVNALKLTNNAIEELIGISSSMRDGIRELVDTTARSALFLARNFDPLTNTPRGTSRLIDRTVPGKRELDDIGLDLIGGRINDLIDAVSVSGFVQRGKRIDTGLDAEGVGEQFSAILKEIVDTVSEAAEFLGVPLQEIEDAIAQFEVESQKISLMDLSAEEQQEELNAVFGRIFDDLAAAVVPFVLEFQQVGEGAGETLLRLGTSIQVVDEFFNRFNMTVGKMDNRQLIEVSARLVELSGGVEEFIKGMTGFFDTFASDAQKMAVAEDDLTRAFDKLGLTLPKTSEGLFALMSSLDPMTEAGAQAIATLLGLTDSLDAYYSALEEIENERMGLERQLLQLQGDTAALRELELAGLDESNRALQKRIWALEDEQAATAELTRLTAGIEDDIARLTMTPLRKEFRDLTLSFRETMSTMEKLGASEDQFAAARQRHALQLQQLAASLIANIQSQVAEFRELLGTDDTASSSQSSPWSGGGNQPVIDDAVENFRDAIINALESIEDWLNDSELNNPSLTKRQRFNRTQDEFDRLVEQALNGSPEEQAAALSALPQLASELEALGVQMYGSATQPFGDLMDRITAGLESVLGIDVPDAEVDVGVTSAQGSAIQTSTETTADNTWRLVEISAQVIESLGVLSQITSQSAIDLAQQHNVPLRQMIEQLIGTVDSGDVGVIDQLIAVANTLGEDLVDVADVIGLEVGTLRDSSSVLSQALQDTILQMPEEIRAQLLEPLDRLWEATTDADATMALDDLLRISADLPAEQRNALAPFFAQIDPIDYLISQTNLLYTISGLQADIAASAAGALGAIGGVEAAVHGTTAAVSGIAGALMGLAEAIRGIATDNNPADPGGTLPPTDLPGMALGGWVNSDTVIRAGEAGRELILPNPVSEFFAREGIPVRMPSAAGGAESAAELRRIAELLAEGNRDRNAGVQRLETAQVAVATSMDEVAREARSMAGMQR